jgi:chromosome segregation ATPase
VKEGLTLNNITLNTGCDTSHHFDELMQELADTIELHRLPVGAYKEIEDLMNKLHRQADKDIQDSYDEGYGVGEAEVSDLQDNIEELEEELEELQSRVEDLEDENRELDSNLDDVTCELEEALDRINELEEELAEYE